MGSNQQRPSRLKNDIELSREKSRKISTLPDFEDKVEEAQVIPDLPRFVLLAFLTLQHKPVRLVRLHPFNSKGFSPGDQEPL